MSLKLNTSSISQIDKGDVLLVKPYGSNVVLIGLVIQQTDDSYAFLYLPECTTFPYLKRLQTTEELIQELKGKYEFVNRVDTDLPINVHTFQDVAFKTNQLERQKTAERIIKEVEKDESLAAKSKK